MASRACDSFATGSSCLNESASIMVISVSRVFGPFSDWEPKQTFRAMTSGLRRLSARLFSASTSGLQTHWKNRSRLMDAANSAGTRLPAENANFLRYALGSLSECDTQLLIAENLGFATYPTRLKASIMSLTMGIRAYAKTLKP